MSSNEENGECSANNPVVWEVLEEGWMGSVRGSGPGRDLIARVRCDEDDAKWKIQDPFETQCFLHICRGHRRCILMSLHAGTAQVPFDRAGIGTTAIVGLGDVDAVAEAGGHGNRWK